MGLLTMSKSCFILADCAGRTHASLIAHKWLRRLSMDGHEHVGGLGHLQPWPYAMAMPMRM